MNPGAASDSQPLSCSSAAVRTPLSKLSAASSVLYTCSTGIGAAERFWGVSVSIVQRWAAACAALMGCADGTQISSRAVMVA